MTTQKPGFQLEASVTAQPGDTTQIQFTLPNKRRVAMAGPPMPAAQIGPLTVMFFPDQFVQILLIQQEISQVHQMRIPLDQLPLSSDTDGGSTSPARPIPRGKKR